MKSGAVFRPTTLMSDVWATDSYNGKVGVGIINSSPGLNKAWNAALIASAAPTVTLISVAGSYLGVSKRSTK